MAPAPAIGGSPHPATRTLDTGTVHRRLPGYHVIWIENGHGIYQIDFQNYTYTGARILFLGPGQYFSVLAGSFTLRTIDLPVALLQNDPQLAAASRVLFTHVYEVGAVVPSPALYHDPYPTETSNLQTWLRDAARHWSAQKPLHPHITPRETNLIFDLRHHIEANYREQRPIRDYIRALDHSAKWINRTTTTCINRTIGELVRSRQILEAKRELFFSDKAVKEIAYELDFSDPAYFSRFFCRSVGVSPSTFRTQDAAFRSDPFLDDLEALIEKHFRRTRSVAFYAAHLFLTPQALSAKVKRLTGQSVGRLIKSRVVAEARRLVAQTDLPVQEIAWSLGFEEAPHFSRFFKHATGQAPIAYRQQR